MELKLRVETGKNAGQEIRVSSAEFLIGRGDGCHLRAGSDMISRQHCMLIVGDSYAGLRDLGSKNGTLVNGEVVHNREVQLRAGDKLRIGPLEFCVVLNAGLTGKKLPAVHNVREAVARSTQSSSNTADDIAGWLMEGDVASSKASSKASATDTQQMRMSDTEEIDIKGAGSSILDASAAGKTAIFHAVTPPAADDAAVGDKSELRRNAALTGPKKLPSKLPSSTPSGPAANTRQAAADMIDKMRKRKQ